LFTTPIYKFLEIGYTLNKTDLERIKQMTTKREYLKSKGITVGARGRFSGAAKVALQEAEKAGIKFAAEPKVQKAK
jgi:hypothetical protein